MMFDSTGERGPPCGVPSLAGLTSPFSIIPARKNARISFSNPFIADLFGDLREQSVVVDPVEKFLEIQIHHPAVAFAWILLRLLHRLMKRTRTSKLSDMLGTPKKSKAAAKPFCSAAQ